MTPSWRCWRWKLGIASLLGVGGAIATFEDCAKAQITPDSTLGAESSVVTPTNIDGLLTERIDGGATRGANLFHSFREFNVGEGRGAYFANPSGIENILSRVTGNSPSNILGRLGALGSANLFLINPNGIIFGPNASLDIGGSFVATTANAIQFAEQGFFSASTPETPPLLTVNPSAFLFNQIATAPIENNSRTLAGLAPSETLIARGLRVLDEKSLLLLSGDVSMDGGGLNAFGGRVELGGVTGAGTVGLDVDGNNLRLIFPGGVTRGDVSLSNGAGVDVTAEGGGSIAINARSIDISRGSFLFAGIGTGLGSSNTQAGDITLNATGAITVTNSSILNDVESEAVGKGGDISIKTQALFLADGSIVRAITSGQGDGGDVRVDVGQLIVQDGSFISTSTFPDAVGQGGDLTVSASEVIELIGTTADGFPSSLLTQTGGAGDGGELTIETKKLTIRNGAGVSIIAFGEGRGGTLTVTASESVELIGTSSVDGLPSGLFTITSGSLTDAPAGDAGNLTIETGRLILQDGAQISADTFDSGNGGDINIKARSVFVANSARLSASSEGTGAAGNIEVAAPSIRLDNQAFLSSVTSGGQGNIFLRSEDLVLRRGSNITTDATGTATGGNITIDTGVIAALEDSDITANAQDARGGRVNINAQGIFGTQSRNQLTPESDITATSNLGPQFSGTVEINTPDVDPSQGLATLPAELVEASGLIATGCAAGEENKFIVTGRGGLPPNPGDTLNGEAVLTNWATLDPEVENRSGAAPSTNSTRERAITQIVEAQGWVINNKGEVVLTALAPNVTPTIPWMNPATCHTP